MKKGIDDKEHCIRMCVCVWNGRITLIYLVQSLAWAWCYLFVIICHYFELYMRGTMPLVQFFFLLFVLFVFIFGIHSNKYQHINVIIWSEVFFLKLIPFLRYNNLQGMPRTYPCRKKIRRSNEWKSTNRTTLIRVSELYKIGKPIGWELSIQSNQSSKSKISVFFTRVHASTFACMKKRRKLHGYAAFDTITTISKFWFIHTYLYGARSCYYTISPLTTTSFCLVFLPHTYFLIISHL